MTTDTITQLTDPQGLSPDPLTDILRSGARLIEQEAELAVLLEAYASDRMNDGRARLVRHVHLPEREVLTGIGVVPVKVPRVRDRRDAVAKVRFRSTILPPYLRKAKSIEELLHLALSQRYFNRRLSRGPRPPAGAERGRAVLDYNLTAQG